MATSINDIFRPDQLLDIDTLEELELGPDPAAVAREQADAEAERLAAELEQRNEAMARQAAELQERLRQHDEPQRQYADVGTGTERYAQQQQAEPRPEDWDPVGQRLWDNARALEQLEAWKQQQELQAQEAQFQHWSASEEGRFTSTQPDYAEAKNHVITRRTEFWTKLGLPPTHPSDELAIQGKAPPQSARALVAGEANLLVRTAHRNGKSFPSVVYNLARQWGYSRRK